MPDMRAVYSSHVSRIGHDADTGDLHVEWDTGKTSIYSGVPPDVAQSVMTSWSVGTALRDQVKGTFDHRYSE